MEKPILKYISLGSLLALAVLILLHVWGIMTWNEISGKIIITLGVVFIVSAAIFEFNRAQLKK